MKEFLRKVFRVTTAKQTDEISFYLHRRNKTPIALQTGDIGCQIKDGDLIAVNHKSSLIKIFAQACIRGCKASKCKIRSKF